MLEDKMNSATMQMSKTAYSSISDKYQLRDMKNSWNIPRVKIKQKKWLKEFWHFLNFYFRPAIWLWSTLKIK